ncbi:MAG: stage III sporulation protein AE [Oscillospiraceae bacterium]|nr:stage III sporulation protein AE [Oscillospiraceae bacterium]
MKKWILVAILIVTMAQPVYATEITAPEAPDSAAALMPVEQKTFGEDLWHVICSAVEALEPDIAQCSGICLCVIGTVMMISILGSFPGKSKSVTELAGAVAVACLLLGSAYGSISAAAETVQQLSDYGKLLLPAMTTAVAAQGGLTSATALYTGTAFFDTILGSLISWLLLPVIYAYLVLSVAAAALEIDLLGKMQKFLKWLTSWGLKIIIYIFTGYMTVTGVISGTADQATLKATKMTISGMVPVVGGMLSDASETILISAGTVKNAVGIYGLLALIAVAIGPFLRIGIQYLMLKITASVCEIFGSKRITGLVSDVSGAMGLLLAMTGTMCLLLMISTVCFLKGVG